MSPRLKSTNTAILSREEFITKIREIAVLQLDLKELETQRDQQIDEIKTAFAKPLLKTNDAITSAFALAEKFAREHRDGLFPGKAKSDETDFATFGFRTSTPSVRMRPGMTEEMVFNTLKEMGLDDRYAELKYRLKKNLLKAADPGLQDKLGIYVDQDETFFVQPKADSLKPDKA